MQTSLVCGRLKALSTRKRMKHIRRILEAMDQELGIVGQLMLEYQEITSGPVKETAMAAMPKKVPKGNS
jgi:hypothetical protein